MKSSTKALISNNKKILLILRDNVSNINDPNKWSLPGGEIEEHESHKEALLRELYEEINLIPQKINYLGKLNLGVDHYFYYTAISDDEVTNLRLGNEGQEYRFFSIDEMSNIELAQNITKYFPLIKSHLKEIIEENKTPNLQLLGLRQ